MAEGSKLGLQTAIAAIREANDDALPDRIAEQQALWPSAVSAEQAGDQAGDGPAERSGPGRPPGSRNRSTLQWTDFILRNYRSPLLFLAEAYTRPAEILAAELGCTKEDAFKIQVSAARELAPYVHQKQPVAVNVDAHGVVTLVIEGGAPRSYVPGDDATTVLEGQLIDETKNE